MDEKWKGTMGLASALRETENQLDEERKNKKTRMVVGDPGME